MYDVDNMSKTCIYILITKYTNEYTERFTHLLDIGPLNQTRYMVIADASLLYLCQH